MYEVILKVCIHQNARPHERLHTFKWLYELVETFPNAPYLRTYAIRTYADLFTPVAVHQRKFNFGWDVIQ